MLDEKKETNAIKENYDAKEKPKNCWFQKREFMWMIKFCVMVFEDEKYIKYYFERK